uniref:Uncharacterized protein n=1 Tax=Meloidogyne incognita TaxID=6306 RepID=A0A914MRZ3_MELIC
MKMTVQWMIVFYFNLEQTLEYMGPQAFVYINTKIGLICTKLVNLKIIACGIKDKMEEMIETIL